VRSFAQDCKRPLSDRDIEQLYYAPRQTI